MKKEDAEEFTQSLGHIVGGSWRQIALAKRLGVPAALGISVDEWVRKRLNGYVRLSVEDRRKAVEELAAEGESTRAIADVLGVDQSTVVRDANASKPVALSDRDIAESDENASPIDAVAALAADNKMRSTAQATETRQRKEGERKADLERAVEIELPPGIHHGDFRELSQRIPDNSVELVFTDPPYDEDSVALYHAAAEVAARILKPGGSLIAYTGQRHLPEVLAGMAEHLRYWWTCAGIHEGGNQILQKLGIRCGWKPLVWFVKDTRGDVQNVMLDIVRGDREKEAHAWQQAVAEAEYFIGRLCPVGGCVVDFFLGGGTSKIAAERLGRRFIGFEVSAAAVETSAKRIRKEAA